MRSQNIAFSITTIGALSILLAGCSHPSHPAVNPGSDVIVLTADYPVYDNLESASEAADLIVTGAYISSEVDLLYPEINNDGDPESNPQRDVTLDDIRLEELAIVTTVSKLRISEVLKGDAKVGDVIVVSQLGGDLDDVAYGEASTTLLSEVDAPEVALLLNDVGDNTFDLVNPAQGMFTVEGDSLEPPATETFTEISTVDELREVLKNE